MIIVISAVLTRSAMAPVGTSGCPGCAVAGRMPGVGGRMPPAGLGDGSR